MEERREGEEPVLREGMGLGKLQLVRSGDLPLQGVRCTLGWTLSKGGGTLL